MRIERLNVDEIKCNDWNPNEMDANIFHSLVVSIKEYGVLQPILLREDMTIIKGEKRWKAAKEAGLIEIICVIVETTDEEAKLLNISLSHLRGRTNEEILASLILDLSQHIDINAISIQTGYSTLELGQLIENLQADTEIPKPVEDDSFDVGKTLLDIKEPQTKRGQKWGLGRHVLMCGDSTSREDVSYLMDNLKANLVVTDPPYNVAVKSTSEKLNADGRGQIMNDDMDAESFRGFLQKVFDNYSAVMDEHAAIYVFHPSSYQREFEDAMNQSCIYVRTQCVWVKNAFSFNFAQYKYKHEPVFYAHLKGQAPSWYGDFKQTTVWKSGLPVADLDSSTIWEISRGDTQKYVHPTQKPLTLLEIPIGNSSRKGDIIVDLFGGSGSTLMTCDQMERTCYTMELDPVFCDVIMKRYEEATGIKPVLLTEI